MSEPILLSAQLPPLHHNVLVWFESDECEEWCTWIVARLREDGDWQPEAASTPLETYYNGDDDGEEGHGGGRATHWMPMPPPPSVRRV